MLNYIWVGFLIIAIIAGVINGRLPEVSKAAFDYAKTAVDIALGLISVMTLWLGIIRIAEHAGMVTLLAKMMKPISKRLFPDIPPEHPAIGAMLLNIAASWLGLSNAATPFGLKAMEELQKLNPIKDVASNSMVTFLALNTTCITIPASIIGIRYSLKSANPEEIIGTTIFAAGCATIIAVITSKVLVRLKVFKITDQESNTAEEKIS
jgi:spore maturation protein A